MQLTRISGEERMSEDQIRDKIYDWFFGKTKDVDLAKCERDALDSKELLDFLCVDSFCEVTEEDIKDYCEEVSSYYQD